MRIALLAVLALGIADIVSAGEDPLSDAQIAHIAYTAGQLDIAAAEQAVAKASDPQVKAFAETMIRDHRAVNEKALALVERLGVTPAANAISASLTEAAATASEKHAALAGTAFDRAYVENEVAYHRQVNDALRTLLIPGARNPELRALLETGLALFTEHQGHAEMLVRSAN